MADAPAPASTDPDDRTARKRSAPEKPAVGLRAYHRMLLMGAIFPFVAGVVLYGWRAAVIVGGVMAATAIGMSLWRRVGGRGTDMNMAQGMWYAALLGLMLPPHVLSTHLPIGLPDHAWALIPAAGLLLAMLIWLLSGTPGIHPALAAYLVILTLLAPLLVPHWVLQRHRLAVGDIGGAQAREPSALPGSALPAPAPGEVSGFQTREASPPGAEGWVFGAPVGGKDCLYVREPAAMRLNWARFTRAWPARKPHFRNSVSLDDMPPLEDLMVGGHPAPIGTGSAIAIIIGGLYLIYRGLIDWRIPLLIAVFAALALLLLPLPYALGDRGTPWQSLLLGARHPSLSEAITFANYQFMASPLLFASFFLATAPALRPMSRRPRILWSLLAGIAIAAAQLYISVPHGPYIALAAIGLLTPILDRCFTARTIV